jgi:hypothetical protein
MLALLSFLTRDEWQKLRRLAISGKETEGIVVQLLPEFHNNVVVEYNVAGKTFKGQRAPRYPNPEIPEVHIGSAVKVFYNPDSPTEMCVEDPQRGLRDEERSITIAASIAAVFLATYWTMIEKHVAFRGSRSRCDC